MLHTMMVQILLLRSRSCLALEMSFVKNHRVTSVPLPFNRRYSAGVTWTRLRAMDAHRSSRPKVHNGSRGVSGCSSRNVRAFSSSSSSVPSERGGKDDTGDVDPPRRLAEFDSMFFEIPSSPEDKKGVGNPRADTDVDGIFDYDDEYPDMDSDTTEDSGAAATPDAVGRDRRQVPHPMDYRYNAVKNEAKNDMSSSRSGSIPSAGGEDHFRRAIPPPLEYSDEEAGFVTLGEMESPPDYQPHLYEDVDQDPVVLASSLPTSIAAPVEDDDFPRTEVDQNVSGNAGDTDDVEYMYGPSHARRPVITIGTKIKPETMDFLTKASSGRAVTTRVDILTERLERLKRDIYQQNNDEEFNLNSPKQISRVLFGDGTGGGQSTNKDVLEAMGSAGNKMADLILQWRRCKRDLKRELTRTENRERRNIVSYLSSPNAPHKWDVKTPNLSRPPNSPNSTVGEQRTEPNINPHDPLLLLDASAYIFRAYYAMPPLHRSDGTPVGAVLGFCNMINRIVLNRALSGQRPRVVLVFDSKGKTFRHFLYPEYKANRKDCPLDLVPQFDLVREAADAYGIVQVEAPAYEADDVIATLARRASEEGVDVNILSGDKDLMQLVSAPDVVPSVHMIDPMSTDRITHDEVVSKWGVPPEKLGDVLALAGDASDNIPGVPGVGPKIAATLINEFGTLDEVLERAEEIKQKGRREKVIEHADKAKLSRTLVSLESSIPLGEMTFPYQFETVSELRMGALDRDKLLGFYHRMGFRDMKRRVEDRLERKAGLSNAGNGTERNQNDVPGDQGEYRPLDWPSPPDTTSRSGSLRNRETREDRKKGEYDDLPF